ncbi:MAG: outer membrane protein assembly factor BamB family protein [Planctomycetota bacterium]|jgi:outer membrane protein assembly factor BamB
MWSSTGIAVLASIMVFCPVARAGDSAPADADSWWPHFRGPRATGLAPQGDPPLKWSELENVKWKVELPGKGHASPIVWKDTIFVLSAVRTEKGGDPAPDDGGNPGGHRRMRTLKADRIYAFVVLAYHRKDGRVLWKSTAVEEMPSDRTHPDGTWASNSPITDGRCVYAYFGSRGLYCYDLKGELQWKKRLGTMNKRMSFGEGSSPALHGDTIVVLQDHEGPSFIVALDKRTGEERWRKARDEMTSWSTPLIVEHGGKAQVITSATKRIRSYDLENGEILWECRGMTFNPIPTPLYQDGLAFLMSGFRGSALLAIRLAEAKGDITGTDAIAWSWNKHTPYTPSGMLHGENLIFLRLNKAIVSCHDVKTGKAHYSNERFRDLGTVYASLVGAKDRFYAVGRRGNALVFKAGTKCEVLARNTLEDSFSATPAIVGKSIILRGEKNLYCLAKPGAGKPPEPDDDDEDEGF